jgi:hypothetical protein
MQPARRGRSARARFAALSADAVSCTQAMRIRSGIARTIALPGGSSRSAAPAQDLRTPSVIATSGCSGRTVVSAIGDAAFFTALGWRAFTLVGSQRLGIVFLCNGIGC